MANAAAGKGYEKESNYSNIKFQFVGIENIHVMRGSLQRLIEGLSDQALSLSLLRLLVLVTTTTASVGTGHYHYCVCWY